VRGRSHGHFVEEQRLDVPLSPLAHERHQQALALFRARQDAGFKTAGAAP